MGMNTRQMLTADESNDLRNVLVAAHFPKRIVKKLVEETNISSSVDKILVEKFPVVTYRVLGCYLIGLTRIYSKKVEYLLVDCNHSLHEMKFFSEGRKKDDVNYGGTCVPESSSRRSQLQVVDAVTPDSSRRKRSYTFLEPMRAQFSALSLPDCFDLDSYDLDVVLDDSRDEHVKPHMELVLKDTWEDQRRLCHALGKEHASGSTSTSAMVAYVEPDTSVEKFMHGFVLEERLDPMVLSDSEDELVLDSAPLIEYEPESNNNMDSSMISEGVRSPEKQPDEEGMTTEQAVMPEMASVDNFTLEPSPDKSQLSVAVKATPRSRALVGSGKRKARSAVVRTPASRTDAKPPRKHPFLYDYAAEVPDEMYRTWVSDVSKLVRKRRTLTDAIEKRGSFDRFMQPEFSIFPEFQSDLSSIISANVRAVVKQVEVTAGPTVSKGDGSKRAVVEVAEEVGPTVSKGDASKQAAVQVVEEAVGPTMPRNNALGPLNVRIVAEEMEAEVIAPPTPATQSASWRFSEACETSTVNQMGPTSSCESQENSISPIRDGDLNEMQTAESKQPQGPSTLREENQENVTSVLAAEKLSAATKRAGRYLHSKFVHSKENGEEEAVNLSQILKPKTKKESARFFYQMLVLKTAGYVEVTQEKAYSDICVHQTQKMKAAFEGGRGE